MTYNIKTNLHRVLVLMIMFTALACDKNQNTSSDIENFNNFFHSFSINENFQKERVVFPFMELEYNGEDYDTIYVSYNEWKHDSFYYDGQTCSEAIPVIYNNFERMMDDSSNERVFAWQGIENGIQVLYFFKRTGNKWFLTKMENNSN
ncbi:DUF4348 domain-containing protein [Psychroserpens burtonensis]|uniref:DUF4348 domain-containing protein n=1 Tax=Psychroserpens burtonensis TaxID=49278 RepID=UPI00042318A2|nr:DUF4348 domain-containing protein [Psychroserpens burtonensis]